MVILKVQTAWLLAISVYTYVMFVTPSEKNPKGNTGPLILVTIPELSVTFGVIHVTWTKLFPAALMFMLVGQFEITGAWLSVQSKERKIEHIL